MSKHLRLIPFADKAKIIMLQDKLLENKDDQIKILESSVEKTVQNSPDRSADEREQRRNLVTELNRLITEQPNRYHFIRAGRVQSVDKTLNLSTLNR